MNQKPLIILITRIVGAPSEWESVWGFQSNKMIAFIRKGETVFVDSGELSLLNFSDGLNQDDVWVINGRQFQNIKLRDALNSVSWNELKREVNLRIHRGGGRSVRYQDFQEAVEGLTFENLKAFLRKAGDYSLGEGPSLNHPVMQFANVIRNKIWNQYNEALKHLQLFSLPPHARLGIVKHGLVHLFLSIDMDLQAWRDSNFDPQYGRDLINVYSEAAKEILAQAHKLVYGDPNNPQADSVQGIINEVMKVTPDDQRELIEDKWQTVQQFLPSLAKFNSICPDEESAEGKAGALFKDMQEILLALQDANGTISLASRLKGSNPFNSWFVKLGKALDELRKTLQGKQSEESSALNE